MLLKGSRVTIRPLNRADLSAMAAWRPFDDPLLADANWLQRAPDGLNRWYTRSREDPRRLLFALLDGSERTVGLLTLREVDGLCSARLGITLGADFVNQGYGTEALVLFLDHFFGELGFEKMLLDVAAHNERAICVYKKLGFKTVGQRKRAPAREMSLGFLRDSRYADMRRFFPRDWIGRRRVLCYEMMLTQKDWKKRKNDDDRSRALGRRAQVGTGQDGEQSRRIRQRDNARS